uniref:Protein kinase domain-containing protein n=1 Tax=Neobodo designis TaxID=312471 RepID=A0A7S1LE70_NEODS|mmetsp:Transcript_20368/g.63282  ORF Transcript_20368/g.63282 Transcript_20368/m.63282 type:complete len:472 (+) Transcript_20368:32-1447(+)
MEHSASEQSISDAEGTGAAGVPAIPRRENPLEPVASPPGRPSPPTSQDTVPRPLTATDACPMSPNGSFPIASADLYIKRGNLIGRGAFGSVYMGINMANSQLVAIKQIRLADASDSVVRSIQREIEVMLKLPPHPNCVRYLGQRSTAKHISIIMEYVSGGSVASLYTAVGTFHEATVRRYAAMALKGLSHLHEHNIVHQDIKGANVLADSEGCAKIADFGCCKDLHLLTGSIKAAGTPLWMAPEVCTGCAATKMSDIWSFGCFVLEMAKPDHMPWSGISGGLFAVMYAIGNAQKPPPFPEEFSDEGCDFLGRCLAIDPSERASADELLTHPWIAGPHNDSWDGFDDGLMPASATQTLVAADLTGCSLKDLGSDSDGEGGDHVLRLPGGHLRDPSDGSPSPMFSPLHAQPITPQTKPVVFRGTGAASAHEEPSNLVAAFEEVTPPDVTPSPSTKGRRKLGEKRTVWQKLFGT